ncbi:MAG TPA: VWA domain-containing protein [Bryobacteraceae bacterium]|nr:VWA domain-containing protein [Bryobacteraceae bacterium]
MKHWLARVCLPLMLAGVLAPQRAWPQSTARGRTISSVASPDAARQNFSVDSTLVLVNVAVTDARGRFVTGLEQQDFQVFEDKTAQTVAYFSAEEAPVSVALVLDFSGSMASAFGKLQQAVAEFLKSANPLDEFCLIEFRDRPEMSMGFTSAPGEIQNRVALTKPEGNTALLDAVYLGLRHMRKARNARKILLIVSDGGDNHSRFRAREVENLARESDVEIYAIGMGSSSVRTVGDLWDGPALLNELADEAGGRCYDIDDPRGLPAVADKIGRELRHQYVLGYVPQNRQRDGRYRRIQVKIARAPGQPRLTAYWKRGYYAPAD